MTVITVLIAHEFSSFCSCRKA